jgi:hypothetical protein
VLEGLVTIILSLVTANFALQISDRLLSWKPGSEYVPWDPASNKSVVVLTRDGLITMGYSGPGFISGATTDGWIAEALTGKKLGAHRSRPYFGLEIGASGPQGFLAVHLNTVADRLNQAARIGQVNRKLSVHYVGFRWQSLKKPAWPVVGRITWNDGLGAYTSAMSKRRWGWDSGRSYLFGATGRSEQLAYRLLRGRLMRTDLQSKEQAAAALLEILRTLPPKDPTVSRDCLVTTVQRVPPHVHIKYEPYGIAQVSVAFRAGTATMPAGFTPWIITPGLLASPQVITGQNLHYQCGVFDMIVEGPDTGGDLSIMSSQRRRLS